MRSPFPLPALPFLINFPPAPPWSRRLAAGIVVRRASDALIELKAVYESHLEDGTPADVSGCEIGDNPNKMWIDGGQTLDATGNTCTITMQVPLDKGDMDPPVLVHYELQNFYQNYRKYITSYDQYQLLGQLAQDQYEVQRTKCDPLAKIGDTYINPCGLVANTLFNDVIELVSVVGPDGTPLDAPLVETGIAWASDLEYKYRQPDGFRSAPCPSCDDCDCNEVDDATGERTWSCDAPYEDVDGVCHRYYYPFDDETQYLYETYPMMINPLEGVTNEHFVVWMRAAALPHFRKLYGYIEVPIPAGSTLTFRIMANFAVERLKGSKALVVGNTYAFGGKNHWLGTLFVTVGSIAAILGLFFLAKDRLAPRKLGDKMYLKYKGD